ncbi:hypothetical protein STEG23_033007, partial [Scotinomys teguina]
MTEAKNSVRIEKPDKSLSKTHEEQEAFGSEYGTDLHHMDMTLQSSMDMLQKIHSELFPRRHIVGFSSNPVAQHYTTLTRTAALRIESRMCWLSWFLDPGGWTKAATVGLYFIFPGICTLSL